MHFELHIIFFLSLSASIFMFAQPSYELARCANYDIYTNTINTIKLQCKFTSNRSSSIVKGNSDDSNKGVGRTLKCINRHGTKRASVLQYKDCFYWWFFLFSSFLSISIFCKCYIINLFISSEQKSFELISGYGRLLVIRDIRVC